MRYRLILANGHVHEDDDERSTETLLKDIVDAPGDNDELPTGWGWYAGLYTKRGEIVAVETLRPRPTIREVYRRVKDIRPQDVIRLNQRWHLVYDVACDGFGLDHWDEDMTALFGSEPADWDERDVFIRYALDEDRSEPGSFQDRTIRFKNPHELVLVQEAS